jgi:hypothetical protein
LANKKLVQVMNFLNREITSTSGDLPEEIRFTKELYTGGTFYLEVMAKNANASNQNIYLHDVDNNVKCTLAITASTTVYTRFRSSSFTPVRENDYHLNIGSTDISILKVHVIVLQDSASIGRTVAQFEIGSYEVFDYSDTSLHQLTEPKYFKFEPRKYDPACGISEVLGNYWRWGFTAHPENDGYNVTIYLRASFDPTFATYVTVDSATLSGFEVPTYIELASPFSYDFLEYDGMYFALFIQQSTSMRGGTIYNVKWIVEHIADGQMVEMDSVDPGPYGKGVWADSNFVYFANDTGGIRSYTVNGSGQLTLKDTNDQGGNYRKVHGDGTWVYAVALGTPGLMCYDVNVTTGVFTLKDSDRQSTWDYYDVFANGTWIFCATQGGGLACYSVDGSGNLTFKDSDLQSSATYYGVWADANYIYCATSAGLMTYTVNGSGILSHVDTDQQNSEVYYNVWGDGTYIHVGCTNGVRSYSESSGVLTYIDVYDGDGIHYGVWADSDWVVIAHDNGGMSVLEVDSNGYYIFIYNVGLGVSHQPFVDANWAYLALSGTSKQLIVYDFKRGDEIQKTQMEFPLITMAQTDTGPQDFNIRWNPAEWDDGNGGKPVCFSEHSGDGSSSNTKLQEDPDGTPADISKSDITGQYLIKSYKEESFETGSATTEEIFGGSGTSEELGQSFQLSSAETVYAVELKLQRTASPEDNLILKITSSLGGTALATSENMDVTRLLTTAQWIRFHFLDGVSLSASTTYYLELSRSGSRDATNYIIWILDTSGGYTNGEAQRKDSGSWAAITGDDFTFRIKTALSMPATAEDIDTYIVAA